MDFVLRRLALPFSLLPGLLLLPLAGCHENYSPNTYSADAAQQEAPVQRGVIIGVRQVLISSAGTTGAAAGAAAGGVAGAQLPTTALGAVGGALVGGIGGAAAEKAIADTKGWEYIVQESNSNLVSITQTSKTALAVGTHVLVIAGSKQARITPDYTVQLPAKTATPTNPAGNAAAAPSPSQPVKTANAPAAPTTSTAQGATAAATPNASTAQATSSAPGPTPTSGAPSAAPPAQAAPSLPADVTNDPILLQAQVSPTTTASGASSSTPTTAASPASLGGSTSTSSTATTHPTGSQ